MMTKTSAPAVHTALPKATVPETLGFIADVLIPNVAKGVILRRPKMVALAERLGLDRRAVRRMQRLRDTYGVGPLLLRIPVRSQAIILTPAHVHRVLEGSPEPFATATNEKVASLTHFQPQGVLISHGPERADRRQFNEAVLDTNRPVHRLAERFFAIVDEEASYMLAEAQRQHELTWDGFVVAWWRVVRRVVLGDAARDDDALTDMLARLRAAANWTFLHPKRRQLREQFYNRLKHHLARAEPGSLAHIIATTPATNTTAPAGQVPQWLFAFDAAGIATFRTLALLAAHPAHATRVQQEINNSAGLTQQDLPYLRACLLEAVRLWPTTPMILRETSRETTWETGVMPANTSILIFVPFFHRDDQQLPYADRFSPELWLDQQPAAHWPLIPFSSGPAMCPGRDLVLLLSSAMLAALLTGRQIHMQPANRLDARRPLPATLNNYALRFKLDG